MITVDQQKIFVHKVKEKKAGVAKSAPIEEVGAVESDHPVDSISASKSAVPDERIRIWKSITLSSFSFSSKSSHPHYFFLLSLHVSPFPSIKQQKRRRRTKSNNNNKTELTQHFENVHFLVIETKSGVASERIDFMPF